MPSCSRHETPGEQRLSLCKGKAEREPAVTGGLVSHQQGKRSPTAPVDRLGRSHGQQTGSNPDSNPDVDLPRIGSRRRRRRRAPQHRRGLGREAGPSLRNDHPPTDRIGGGGSPLGVQPWVQGADRSLYKPCCRSALSWLKNGCAVLPAGDRDRRRLPALPPTFPWNLSSLSPKGNEFSSDFLSGSVSRAQDPLQDGESLC
jgi:hypothetical protein